MRRWGCRVDAAQPGIVRELLAAGCSVIDVHAVGGDAPDLIVGRRGVTVLVEVKTAARAKEHKARLAQQADARDAWQGAAFIQATTSDAILAALDAAEAALARPVQAVVG